MVWLLTHIWMALGVAAFFGLLLGSSIRGIMLRGKATRAAVERDIVRTELEQAQAEIEGLYSAQRKATPANDGIDAASQGALRGELEAHKSELQSKASELATASTALAAKEKELTDLKAALDAARKQAEAASVKAAPAPAAAAPADPPKKLDEGLDQQAAAVIWRNRYLESRVRLLEGKISDMAAAAPAVEAAEKAPAEAAPAAEPAPGKLLWQNEYLKQRMRALEEGAVAAAKRRTPAATAVAPEPAPQATIAAAEAEPARPQEDAPHPADAMLGEIEIETVDPVEPVRADKPRGGDGDDLKSIDGIGPRIEGVLKNELGVYHLNQIAGWSPGNVAWVEDYLNFDGRVRREDWVSQAKSKLETPAAG